MNKKILSTALLMAAVAVSAPQNAQSQTITGGTEGVVCKCGGILANPNDRGAPVEIKSDGYYGCPTKYDSDHILCWEKPLSQKSKHIRSDRIAKHARVSCSCNQKGLKVTSNPITWLDDNFQSFTCGDAGISSPMTCTILDM